MVCCLALVATLLALASLASGLFIKDLSPDACRELSSDKPLPGNSHLTAAYCPPVPATAAATLSAVGRHTTKLDAPGCTSSAIAAAVPSASLRQQAGDHARQTVQGVWDNTARSTAHNEHVLQPHKPKCAASSVHMTMADLPFQRLHQPLHALVLVGNGVCGLWAHPLHCQQGAHQGGRAACMHAPQVGSIVCAAQSVFAAGHHSTTSSFAP